MDLTEAKNMLAKLGFDINATPNDEDELDQIPYYENERFGHGQQKKGLIFTYLMTNCVKRNMKNTKI